MDGSRKVLIRSYLLGKLLLFTLAVYSTPPLHGQCFAGGLESIGELYESTGDENLDNMLYHYKNKMENLFDVQTYMYIYNDSENPNAIAVRCTDFSKCKDGIILLGYNMLNEELSKSNYKEYAIVGVIAHEFAHILQYEEEEDLPNKLLELHADFLAGYYLGKHGFSEEEIEVFAQSLFEMGDYNFWDPDHHGTPEERVKAMVAGFMVGSSNQSVDEAYSQGITWVEITDRYSDFEVCNACGGRGKLRYPRVECVYCGGSGTVICDYCEGQGGYWTNGPYGYSYYSCRKCGGNKRLWCSECDGRGFSGGYEVQCGACNGEGRVRRR